MEHLNKYMKVYYPIIVRLMPYMHGSYLLIIMTKVMASLYPFNDI